MPWIFISFCDNSRGFLVFPCVCVGLQKQKLMNQLGHWNGHWDCGTDKEKLQVALFSTKLFTEESDFFFFRFFFPKWRHPITCGSWPCSLLESFLKVERFFSFQLIHVSSLLCRSWNDKCQLLHFFTPIFLDHK